MTKRETWILETQMFQRVAGVPETSVEELGLDFDQMINTRRQATRRRNAAARDQKIHDEYAALSAAIKGFRK